jgi:magnesium transporter
MDINVLSLLEDFTVAQSIQILQRLKPDQELHRRIFVTSHRHSLRGYILLEDLVLKNPGTRLVTIIRPVEFAALADEDQQEVAQKMTHYDVTIAPVVDRENRFLGVISAEGLVDIIEEESSEDIYRMATMSPIKHSYFETSFFSLLYHRSFILILLLFAQTFSTIILRQYEFLLAGFLFSFVTMLASTGGNVSSQTSALVIQGLATGELSDENIQRFIWREFLMAIMIGFILAMAAFVRVYFGYYRFWEAIAVSLSLGVIVVISVMLGSCMPLILKRLNLDPAHSAGPLLATVMDIVGLFTFCAISWLILG